MANHDGSADDILEKSDLQSFVKSQQQKRQSSLMGDTDDNNDLSMSLLVNNPHNNIGGVSIGKRQSMHDRCETE